MKISRIKAILLCTIMLISIFLCSCSQGENNKKKTTSPTSESTISPSQSLEIVDKQSLIKLYTEEISKLTTCTIISTTYENYDDETDVKAIDVITKMSDGKTLEISAIYISDWSISIIKNKENSHCYYVSGDGKIITDMYDYNSDVQIPREQYINSYTLKNVSFDMLPEWDTNSDTNKYIFYNKSRQLQISVLVNKAPYKSVNKIWDIMSTQFNDYKLKKETSIQIGGQKAKQWEFSYTNDGQAYDAVITMSTYKNNVYIFSLISSFYLDNMVYDSLLESVSWKK